MSNVFGCLDSQDTWSIVFTPHILERIALSEGCKPDDVMEKVIHPVITGETQLSPADLYGLLWLLLQDQAEKRGIDQKAFAMIGFRLCAEGEKGDSDYKPGFYEALEVAVINFTPRNQQPMLREVFRRSNEVMARTAEIFRSRFDALGVGASEEDLTKIVDQALAEAQSKAEAEAKEAS